MSTTHLDLAIRLQKRVHDLEDQLDKERRRIRFLTGCAFYTPESWGYRSAQWEVHFRLPLDYRGPDELSKDFMTALDQCIQIEDSPKKPTGPIVAYFVTNAVEGEESPHFAAVVFTDTEENARKAGEIGYKKAYRWRKKIHVERALEYDSKYIEGMKVNECLNPAVVDGTWDSTP